MKLNNAVKIIVALISLFFTAGSISALKLDEARAAALDAVRKLSGESKGEAYDAIEVLYCAAQSSEQCVKQVESDVDNVVRLSNDKEIENKQLRNENATLKLRVQELESIVETLQVKSDKMQHLLDAKEQEKLQLISKQQQVLVQQKEATMRLENQLSDVKKLEQLIDEGLVANALS